MKQQRLPFLLKDLSIDLCKYMLLVSPDQRIINRIDGVKKTAYRICKGKGVYTLAHITIASFYAGKHLEPLLLQVLQEICDRQLQFRIRFQGIDGFVSNDNCTIYIRIEEHQPFLKFANDLRLLSATLKSSGYRVANRVNNPHCTIVRGLPRATYTDAMHFYKDNVFYDTCLAKNLVLMKREIVDSHSQLITTFQLPSPHYLLN